MRPDQAARPAQTLRRLWPLLPNVTVGEHKSPNAGYRRGDLHHLLGCTHIYCAQQLQLPRTRGHGEPVPPEEAPLIAGPTELAAALFVPARTPALDDDARAAGLKWSNLGGGSWKVTREPFALHVVELARVAERERDDLRSLLSHEEFTSTALALPTAGQLLPAGTPVVSLARPSRSPVARHLACQRKMPLQGVAAATPPPGPPWCIPREMPLITRRRSASATSARPGARVSPRNAARTAALERQPAGRDGLATGRRRRRSSASPFRTARTSFRG